MKNPQLRPLPAMMTFINPEEKRRLEYRAQLKRLQEEVVDIEDMSDGISIMDLGLSRFRLDLPDYQTQRRSGQETPMDFMRWFPATDELPEA